MNGCILCPRKCGADRAFGETGYCGVDDRLRIARCAPHMWEEPAISGVRGAGAVFFSGCPLRCVYCQNRDVSRHALGYEVGEKELTDMIRALAKSGVHNIEFVTPTHFTDRLIPIIRELKKELDIPLIWNTGGYERVETLRMLEGLVDIYLPDYKYASSKLAASYSSAPDYPDVITEALSEMYRQTGKAVTDGNGMLVSGVVVRHLVLPGCRRDSENVLRTLSETLPVDGIFLSLMSQYTPGFSGDTEYRNLQRRVTSFEYDEVTRLAEELGFKGWLQERNSAECSYTPKFSGTSFDKSKRLFRP